MNSIYNENGLTDEDVQKSLASYGNNSLVLKQDR